jgi:hypothetical protein
MALIPKTKYPANVDTSDASYPLGKARNVATAGDGSGTPLEKDWVNDLWGFFQAVLAAGSVVASGTPDSVGTSQYLSALRSAAYAWTAQHTFTLDVNYDAPKTFSRFIPLSTGKLSTAAMSAGLRYDSSLGSEQWIFSAGYSGVVTFPLDLATGAVVTDLRMLVHTSGFQTFEGFLTGQPFNPTTGTSGSAVNMRDNAGGASPASGDASIAVPVSGSASQVIDRSANQYNISVSGTNPGTPTDYYLRGLWIQYTMPGYRNG